MKKVIIYYTDSRLEPELDGLVRKQIKSASNGIKIVSVSQKPLDFGENICVGLKPRSYLQLYKQLLTGLEAVDDDSLVYLCEHDVFYHPSYFEFVPLNKESLFFNLNRFYWQKNAKFFLRSIGKRALSQCIAYKSALLEYTTEQIDKRIRNVSCPNIGLFSNFISEYPNVDIRHAGNFSQMGPFDISDKSRRVLEIPYWGTPRMFQQKTGYKDVDVSTVDKLHSMFNMKCYPNPVTLRLFKRKKLPMLFEQLGFKKGAEIGVKRGAFSYQICKEMPGVELYCIDDYKPTPKYSWDEVEKFFDKAQKKLANYNVKHIKKSSLQAAREDVADGELDFVHIDANHTFDHVMQDIIVWTRKVRRGGIVSGHDYDLPDVRMAVDVYCQRHKCELFVSIIGGQYPDNAPSWFFAKK